MCNLNGQIVDLRDIIDGDATLNINTFDTDEGKKAFWHTSSHILAQAVKRLYLRQGLRLVLQQQADFYYDFDCDVSFNSEILIKIEDEMKKIIKESPKIEKYNLSRDKQKSL